jgi:predicted amidohydrolase
VAPRASLCFTPLVTDVQLREVTKALASGGHVVDLVAALLRYCRRHHDDLRVRMWERSSQRRHAAIVEDAANVLASTGSLATSDWPPTVASGSGAIGRDEAAFSLTESLDAATGKALADLVGDPVSAHAVATALDEHAHAAFFGRYDGVATRLRAGDPFPVPWPRAAPGLFGTHLTAHPERQDDRVDHTEHLRLLDDDRGFYVVLDGRVRLPEPAAGRLVAALVPDVALPVDAAFTWRTDVAERRFGDVLPRDPEAQWRRIAEGLDRADRAGAWAVVLPELSITEELADRVRTWLTGARHVALVAAGSYHASTDGRLRRNLAPVIARDGKHRSHAKVYPFERGGQIEDIRPGRRVTVWATRRWSFTVVVCRDLLSTRLVPLLEDLRVRFVLAPAFSPRTAEMEAIARYLAVRVQGAVLAANTPHAENDAVAWMAQPVVGGLDVASRRIEGGLHLVFFALGAPGKVT